MVVNLKKNKAGGYLSGYFYIQYPYYPKLVRVAYTTSRDRVFFFHTDRLRKIKGSKSPIEAMTRIAKKRAKREYQDRTRNSVHHYKNTWPNYE